MNDESGLPLTSICGDAATGVETHVDTARELQRLNRALRVLYKCNHNLINAVEEQLFLADACRLAVENGGYLMAWVGYAEHDAEKTVRTVAQSGHEEGYLEHIKISWDDSLAIGHGPTGTAIRTASTQINQDCRTNPKMAPWRDAVLARGYQSSIALPLISHSQTLGALTLYAAEPDAFTAEEVLLLEELANHLTFGIETLRLRRQREANETSLLLQVRRAEALLELPRAAEAMDEKAFMQRGQELAEDLTGSKISFIHFVNDDEETIELVTWSRRTLSDYCQATFDKHYPVSQAGIWADALRRKRPVIFNDYATYQPKLGLPEGHAALGRLISLPVMDRGKVMMLVGVGNKSTDYTDLDVETVQLIANEIWSILQRNRAKKKIARFSHILAQSLNEIYVFDSQTMQFVDVNLGARNNLGYTLEELQQMRAIQIKPDFTAKSYDELLAQLRTGEMKHIRFETVHRRKEGTRYPVEVHLELSDDDPPLFVEIILDTTERKEAELALVESEKRFALFMDTLPAAAFIKDVDGRTVYANRSMKAILGEGAWRGSSPVERFPPELAERMIAADRRAMETGYSVEEEHVPGADGQFRDYRTHKFSIHREGRPPLLGGIAIDITEHKVAEERLLKLSQAVEQSPESIVITNLDAEIEYVNRAFVQATGYTSAEVIGRNPSILQSGKTLPENYASLWDALTSGKAWQGEFYNKRKNGEIYIESARISPVRQPDGRISHYLAVKEDITERKRAAEAIHESKMLLQRVIDSTPDWVYVKDREHRFRLVNEPFAKAFNQSPESMIGRYDSDFLPLTMSGLDPVHSEAGLHDGDAAVFNGRALRNPAEKITFKNDETRVFDSFRGPLLDASQQIYGILCYRRDITDRYNKERQQQALERQLLQAQKMELIGHLTGGIAHDFNNILASILGFTEVLQMSPEFDRNLKAGEYLQEILQAGIRGKELVAQLLTFSHRRDAASEAIPVAPIVKEVSKLLRSTLPVTISMRTSIAKRVPEVLISPVQLHQILMNLGINARDAITDKGDIDFLVEPVDLKEMTLCSSCHEKFSGSYVMISVRDSGAGISPDNLPKIFDPFFTTKGVGHGSGLGLSVLHGIVHSANGHIEVCSVVGLGTGFHIFLPAQSPANSRLAQELHPDAALAVISGHVLVVDDEASIVGFMTALLENLGCRVTGLTSATEALRLFNDNPHDIDMVITDQSMPDLTGADLARTLLARRPDLPVVLATGYSNSIDEDTARRIGIRRLLIKPVPAKVFADVIRECLGPKT